jgi:hypothetical protein
MTLILRLASEVARSTFVSSCAFLHYTLVPNSRCSLLGEVSTKHLLTVDLFYACGMVVKYICVNDITGNT